MAQCPAHADNNPSLHVTGIPGQVIVHCFGGCKSEAILDALAFDKRDYFDDRNGVTYEYSDGYTKRRYADKSFRAPGRPSVLYGQERIAEAVAARGRVFVVEGEKDCDTAATFGLLAVTSGNSESAANADWSPLYGLAEVVVVADRDDGAGMKFAQATCAALRGHVDALSIVQARSGKDLSDHLAGGLSVDELELVEQIEAPPGLYFNMAALLAGELPAAPKPSVMRRSDGAALFYAGAVNTLFGPAESGKTWVALAAVAEALSQGQTALVVDLDHNGPVATAARLLALGVPADVLSDQAVFRYVEPEDASELLAVVSDCRTWAPGVSVVDSMGELMPMLGLKSNDADDFTQAHGTVLKPLAMAGSCVIVIDHVSKSFESQQMGATGTIAKRRVIDGVSLRVTPAKAFTPGVGGSCRLNIHKDRHGGLRAVCPTGSEPVAGNFTMTPVGDALTWTVERMTGTELVDGVLAGDSDVELLGKLNPPPKSVSDVQKRMGWRGRQRAADALREWRSSVPGTFPERSEQ